MTPIESIHASNSASELGAVAPLVSEGAAGVTLSHPRSTRTSTQFVMLPSGALTSSTVLKSAFRSTGSGSCSKRWRVRSVGGRERSRNGISYEVLLRSIEDTLDQEPRPFVGRMSIGAYFLVS